ncbi:MAG: type II secretion system F family protein [Halobacteriaceae archaeon]
MTAVSLDPFDRLAYALFSSRAERARHGGDRRRYRGTTMTTSFEVYLARVYGLSWLAFAAVAVGAVAVLRSAPVARTAVRDAASAAVGTGLPAWVVTAAIAVGGGLLCKRGTVWLGGRYLGWRARARRFDIERTLPGAVRYLRALSAGAVDERTLLGKVADRPGAYGETAVAFQSVLNRAALTGSLDTATRLVARDTPSQATLSPFLLKLREHAGQGPDAIENYLDLEARMLGRRQARQRQRAEGFLELLAELFIVLLVLPTLLVIVLTVLSVLAPGLGAPVRTPVGATTVRVVLVYAGAAFVLGVGLLAAWLVQTLRPPNVTISRHGRSDGPRRLVRTALRNPANAAVAFLPASLLVGSALATAGLAPVDVALLAYVAYGVPVGLVSVRRARLDDAKDREIKDFVHAVSGHVSLGRPLPDAVERVARDVDLGPLDDDVADLAFDLQTTSREADVRTAALEQFTARVGTELAGQTVGLVTGALEAGSDPGTVFDALQAEVGRLYHQRRALRANLLVYVAVGWTTALLILGIMVAVNRYVLGSFEQLTAVAGSMDGYVLQPGAVDPARDRHRFYVVTQATMLASGWFAGYASRDWYEALLHSSTLVVLAFVVFTVVGVA